MKYLRQLGLTLLLLCGALGAAHAQTAARNTTVQVVDQDWNEAARQRVVQVVDQDWNEAARQRVVPVRLRVPAGGLPRPGRFARWRRRMG
jgi:hypothetical protein